METAQQQGPPHRGRAGFHLSPPQIITISFAAMILVGASLLNLPLASNDGQSIGFLNALVTATSANCVTGLIVVNTFAHWTVFGKIVIITLIQFGGLGLITILTASMVVLKRRINLRNRSVIQATYGQDGIGGMVRFVKSVLKITLTIEAVGAVLLGVAFYVSTPMSVWEACYKGIFHSISAFCNAGFDIIGPASLTPYQGNLAINLIIMALIVSGGLGFTVWGDVIEKMHNRKKRPLKDRLGFLALGTKIALLVTAALIVLGAGIFLALEWNNPATLGPMPVPGKILAAFFQSVTLRTCGFNSIDQAGLTDFSKLISSILMFIGGSPAGTAGGIKTVTLGIVLVAMYSALRGRSRVEALGRNIPLEQLQKALAVTCAFFAVVFVSVFILHFSEQNSVFEHDILDLIFEITSAAGTVGVTTGITPHLSNVGKWVISLCMFVGRLGPVTVVLALQMKMRNHEDSIAYPDEKVLIG